MNRRVRDDDIPCSTAGSTRISRQPEPFQTPAETGPVSDEGTRGALQRLRPGRRLPCRHLEPLSPAPRTRRPPPPPLSILCRVSPPQGAARLRQKQRLSRPQTGPACSLPLSGREESALVSVYLAAFGLGPLTHRMGICAQTGGCLWPGLLRAEQMSAENTLKRPSSQAKCSSTIPLDAKMLPDAL